MAKLLCFVALGFLTVSAQLQKPGTIPEVAKNKGLTTLIDLATKANLLETLSGAGPLTLFAPTNGAYASLPAETLKRTTSDPNLLKQVIQLHNVQSRVELGKMKNEMMLTSLQGGKLRVNVYEKTEGEPTVTINGSPITVPNVEASNGIIHVIGKPMSIPGGNVIDVLSADPRFSTLVSFIQKAGLVDTLKGDDFTIFAPTNDAFAKLPANTINTMKSDVDALKTVLLRHLVPVRHLGVIFSAGISKNLLQTANNQQLRILASDKGINVSTKLGQAQIVQPDIVATNGAIHAINGIL